MLNCVIFFFPPDIDNNGICFLLLQLVKWPYFTNFTGYCFLLLLGYFLYFRFWRNLPCKFAGKKRSSQRMCWELDLISPFFVRYIWQCSSPTLVPEKKPTVLPRRDSIGDSVPIYAKIVGTVWRNFSLRKQSVRCLTLPVKRCPSLIASGLGSPTQANFCHRTRGTVYAFRG